MFRPIQRFQAGGPVTEADLINLGLTPEQAAQQLAALQGATPSAVPQVPQVPQGTTVAQGTVEKPVTVPSGIAPLLGTTKQVAQYLFPEQIPDLTAAVPGLQEGIGAVGNKLSSANTLLGKAYPTGTLGGPGPAGPFGFGGQPPLPPLPPSTYTAMSFPGEMPTFLRGTGSGTGVSSVSNIGGLTSPAGGTGVGVGGFGGPAGSAGKAVSSITGSGSGMAAAAMNPFAFFAPTAAMLFARAVMAPKKGPADYAAAANETFRLLKGRSPEQLSDPYFGPQGETREGQLDTPKVMHGLFRNALRAREGGGANLLYPQLQSAVKGLDWFIGPQDAEGPVEKTNRGGHGILGSQAMRRYLGLPALLPAQEGHSIAPGSSRNILGGRRMESGELRGGK